MERLAIDHANAKRLAVGFARIPELTVAPPDTNLVWVTVSGARSAAFSDFLAAEGIGITGGYPGSTGVAQQRWVTHLDVSDEDVEGALALVDRFFA